MLLKSSRYSSSLGTCLESNELVIATLSIPLLGVAITNLERIIDLKFSFFLTIFFNVKSTQLGGSVCKCISM